MPLEGLLAYLSQRDTLAAPLGVQLFKRGTGERITISPERSTAFGLQITRRGKFKLVHFESAGETKRIPIEARMLLRSTSH
jgi:hypothetical protein